MSGRKPVFADATAKSSLDVIERQLTDDIANLRIGLAMQIKDYPHAKLALSELIGTWIDEAELALITYRETGVVPPIDAEAMIARAKRRYKAELVVVRLVYRDFSLDEEYERMCARIDGFYPAYLQRLANDRVDYQIA